MFGTDLEIDLVHHRNLGSTEGVSCGQPNSKNPDVHALGAVDVLSEARTTPVAPEPLLLTRAKQVFWAIVLLENPSYCPNLTYF